MMFQNNVHQIFLSFYQTFSEDFVHLKSMFQGANISDFNILETRIAGPLEDDQDTTGEEIAFFKVFLNFMVAKEF